MSSKGSCEELCEELAKLMCNDKCPDFVDSRGPCMNYSRMCRCVTCEPDNPGEDHPCEVCSIVGEALCSDCQKHDECHTFNKETGCHDVDHYKLIDCIKKRFNTNTWPLKRGFHKEK